MESQEPVVAFQGMKSKSTISLFSKPYKGSLHCNGQTDTNHVQDQSIEEILNMHEAMEKIEERQNIIKEETSETGQVSFGSCFHINNFLQN